ncbi:MAG: IS21-like element helper ATPase IstB [Bacteroidota bacterium]|nr:IS21-like element helper ATPase IstB [Bacteroidota bacterium]
MADALENILSTKQSTNLNTEQMLEVLVQQEFDLRHSKRIDRLTKQAHFRYQATIEQIKPDTRRNIDPQQLAALSTCVWIEKGENLLITGPTGVGKSYLATAIGNQACMNGFKVQYFNAQKLFYNLRLAKIEGTHRKLINTMAKSDLLIIDDFGLHKLDDMQRLDLMEIIEDRHGNKSTLVASQLPVATWYEIIAEPTLSDAILDRLTAKANRVDLQGESLRK